LRRRFFRRASGNPTAPLFKGTGDPVGKTMDEPDDRSRPRGDVSDTTDARGRPEAGIQAVFLGLS
jgi:hypothetical protein